MQNILIVENHDATARVIQLGLERAGFEVAIASNGLEALTRLAESDFDLLVVDYSMPEMDGHELCLRLRQCERWANLPVILVSARLLELDVEHMKQELRLMDVFQKPFSPRALIKTIEKHTAQSSCAPKPPCPK